MKPFGFRETQTVLVRFFGRDHDTCLADWQRNPNAPAVHLTNVCKSFASNHNSPHNRPVLNQVNLTVNKGEVVVLLGASGCGKSTLLRLINGLEKPDTGDVVILGSKLNHPPAGFSWEQFRSEVGMVFQQFNLFPHMTVLENVSLAPRVVRKQNATIAKERALELLETVGLADRAHAYPNTLSGGEKQRVAIARALAMSPKILLLDEPTSALDPVMTHEVLSTIERLAHQGVTMMVVTHEVEFAKKVADRVLFLHEGEIVVDGRPNTITNPVYSEHPALRQYLAGVAFESLEDCPVER